jgi:hypothetical protein
VYVYELDGVTPSPGTVTLNKSGLLDGAALTVSDQDGRALLALLTTTDLRELAETANAIANEMEKTE